MNYTNNQNIFFSKHQLLRLLFCFLLIFSTTVQFSFSQNKAHIWGYITDDKKQPLEIVNIAVLNTSEGTISDPKGYYEISVAAEDSIILVFSRVGFKSQEYKLFLRKNERRKISVSLVTKETELPSIQVSAERGSREGMQKIDPKVTNFVPSASGSLEQLIKLTALGVSTTSELSSTYSVRGGNFDENLVYVNDIEIYRPFLVRSGQQEGLSFLNSDLAESVFFSSGGFDASYGDKMASVLDVRYKRPEKFAAGGTASFLGGNIYTEGISKNKKLMFLAGLRYKSNQYLLRNMETKGDYKPQFGDFQSFLTYKFSPKTEISWLNYISLNSFRVVPQTRETSYGTINDAYRLTVYFEGEEVDNYSLYKNAFTLTHKPSLKLQLTYTLCGFISNEQETYDVLGEYWIGKLETDFGKPGFGEVSENRGVGSFLNHSRNFLNAAVLNAEHRGKYYAKSGQMQWGIKTQYENITDKISEWTYVDSAGYSLPYNPGIPGYSSGEIKPYQYLDINDALRSEIEIHSFRNTGYYLFIRECKIDSSKLIINAGVRGNYWTLNKQFIASPRATISLKPNKYKNLTLRLQGGMYYQPPFYRELRNTDGTINTSVKAQRSIHAVAGTDIDLNIWHRPFKFTSEVYYKYLDNLIPYIVDNVRIKYLPNLQSKGYATGIDFKINGEFVKGIESWANLSFMQTKEDIAGDYYEIFFNTDGEQIIKGYTNNDTVAYSKIVNPGNLPRPTDQRVSFSLFFQDYFPNNPSIRMHLGIFFGTGLPFGPPNSEKYKQVLRMPSYRRVDVGFSKQLISEGGYAPKFFSSIKNAWINLEVLNLLQVNNTISYIWISDVNGRLYAIPNYLTARQLNLKLLVQF